MPSPPLLRYHPPRGRHAGLVLPGADSPGLSDHERALVAFNVAMNALDTILRQANKTTDGRWATLLTADAYVKLRSFVADCVTGGGVE